MSGFSDYETVRSCIFGHAVGDALGLPVQFKSREQIEKRPVKDMFGHGVFDMPAGSWSDDTSMTLCALDALSDSNFSWDLVMKYFERWLYNGDYTPGGFSYDVGRTCMAAVRNYTLFKDYRTCGLTGGRDNGNGSLMRIIPFALYDAHNTEFIETASSLTHAHPRARIACVIYSLFLDAIIKTKDKSCLGDVLAGAKALYADARDWSYYEPLFGIEKRDRDSINSSGYVVDTLEAALWCLMTTDTYKDCVLKAVNLGLDTDTVAAVAGGLAGALYGYDAIPAQWLEKLKKKEFINSLCVNASY